MYLEFVVIKGAQINLHRYIIVLLDFPGTLDFSRTFFSPFPLSLCKTVFKKQRRLW